MRSGRAVSPGPPSPANDQRRIQHQSTGRTSQAGGGTPRPGSASVSLHLPPVNAVSTRISAPHAGRLLEGIRPAGAVDAARGELAAEFLEDLRRIDAQMSDAKKKLTTAVRASGTTLTSLFGVGPVIAATVIGEVRAVSRFADRDHFAAYHGTAPIEVSSGPRKIYRLSRRGNRRHGHAIHMAAVTQVSQRHSDGRAYYERKRAEGKTPKEALRSLKRRVSDAVFAQLQADARRAATGPR